MAHVTVSAISRKGQSARFPCLLSHVRTKDLSTGQGGEMYERPDLDYKIKYRLRKPGQCLLCYFVVVFTRASGSINAELPKLPTVR